VLCFDSCHLRKLVDLHDSSNFNNTANRWRKLALAGDSLVNSLAFLSGEKKLKENHTLWRKFLDITTNKQKKDFSELFAFHNYEGFQNGNLSLYEIQLATLFEACMYLEYQKVGWKVLSESFKNRFSVTFKSNICTYKLGYEILKFHLIVDILHDRPNSQLRILQKELEEKIQKYSQEEIRKIGNTLKNPSILWLPSIHLK
jgi:hypothetical protein